jgi:hypothetical protein
MLYYIPHIIGLFTTTDNNQIQLKYLSNSDGYNNFPTSLLVQYINNTPIICLISETEVSILHIKESYIHQLVPTYNNKTLSKTNKKKRTIKQEETQIPISAPPINY